MSSRYTQIRMLGKGAQGQVYLVRDNDQEGKLVVMKVQPLTSFSETEAYILRYLSQQIPASPYLVQFYDSYIEGENLVIIMEYIEGIEVGLYSRSLIPSPESYLALSNIVKDICEGIRYLHEKDVVHRDIKPGNVILVSSTHQIKIVDYGLSCYIPDCKWNSAGTYGFMAPELLLHKRGTQIKDIDQFKKIDIYALGGLIFTLFRGESIMTILKKEVGMTKILSHDYPLIPDVIDNTYIPDMIRILILKMMNPKVQERPSIYEVITELLTIIETKNFIITPTPELTRKVETRTTKTRETFLLQTRIYLKQMKSWYSSLAMAHRLLLLMKYNEKFIGTLPEEIREELEMKLGPVSTLFGKIN